MDWQKAVEQGAHKYPKPEKVVFTYGTAGFRGPAQQLPSVMYRCGVLASLRSLDCNGVVTGIMVTASHNPEADNGVKFVEPSGEMLIPDWEVLANSLAAQPTPEALLLTIENEILSKINNKLNGNNSRMIVYIGHDTRASANKLVQIATQGAQDMGAEVVNRGLCTTPQFHYIIMATNQEQDKHNNIQEVTNQGQGQNETSQGQGQGQDSTDKGQGYVRHLSDGFMELINRSTNKFNGNNDTLYVDCANGVGGVRLRDFADILKNEAGLRLELKNTGEGALNYLVGSDFVEKECKLPQNFEQLPQGFRGCSVDGDADRLVYFTSTPEGIILFNGDKIAALAALFIQKSIQLLQNQFHNGNQIRIGVVQTAYANGASMKFLKEKLDVEVVCTKTGVKHLHHAALAFDVGIYFEANGHGTVLFSQRLREIIQENSTLEAAKDLLALMKTVNQAVGDAISGILMVEAILLRMSWTLSKWEQVYQDLPSKQLKVKVHDRSQIVTTNSETECLEPAGLQEEINKVVSKFESGRAFARPSGTEDFVRVYAEAASKFLADQLALEVAKLVFKLAGGIGDEPM